MCTRRDVEWHALWNLWGLVLLCITFIIFKKFILQIYHNSSLSWLSYVYLQIWLTCHLFFFVIVLNHAEISLSLLYKLLLFSFFSNARKNVQTRWFSNSFLCFGFTFSVKTLCFWFNTLPLFLRENDLKCHCLQAHLSCEIVGYQKSAFEEWYHLLRVELGEPSPISTLKHCGLVPCQCLWGASCRAVSKVDECCVWDWRREQGLWPGSSSFLICFLQEFKAFSLGTHRT